VSAGAAPRLLEEPLRPPRLVRLDADQPSKPPARPSPSATPEELQPPPLDFDLLGTPPPQPKVDEGALRLRRTMLSVHQGAGFGLLALQLATTVVGQLNYSDRFAGGPSTGRYQLTHKVLAYSTLGVFAADGLVALLAPSPLRRNEGFDRVTLHRIAMFTAAGGLLAQAILGITTREREGYLNQQGFATAHLVVGYVTLAAVGVGVGALIF
jgi:hypothetical protein